MDNISCFKKRLSPKIQKSMSADERQTDGQAETIIHPPYKLIYAEYKNEEKAVPNILITKSNPRIKGLRKRLLRY